MSTNKMSKNLVSVGGFMCRSNSSTAVCVPDNMQSIIAPRRVNPRTLLVDNHVKLASNVKYSRLVDPQKRVAKGNRKENLLPLVEDIRDRQKSAVAHKQKMQQKEEKKHRALQLTSFTKADAFQVVVLKVSIHCQGCAGKVKKHLSSMDGVTSFSIDLEEKRVTVMGHISPAGVLESVSRVKRAEFWSC